MDYIKLYKIFLFSAEHDLILDEKGYKILNIFIANTPNIDMDQKIVDYCFKNFLKDRLELNYLSAENLLKHMVNNYAKKYNIDCNCEIIPVIKADSRGLETCYGTCELSDYSCTIQLSKTLLDYLLNSPYDWYQAFITLFHEIEHAKMLMQNKKTPDYNDYLSLKDLIIDNSNYYKTNYVDINYESIARITSVSKTIDYVKKLGIEMSEKDKLRYVKRMAIDKLLHYRNHRRSNGKKYESLDLIFDEKIKTMIIENKNIFDEYPILREFYNEDGSKKSTLTLLERMDELNPSTNLYKLIRDEVIYSDSTLDNTLNDIEELMKSDYKWDSKKDFLSYIFSKVLRHSLRVADNSIKGKLEDERVHKLLKLIKTNA